MNEKIAINDTLSNLNSAITMLTYSIEQANNERFRDLLLDYRTKLDNLQYDIYKIAKEKAYYVPAAPAGEADLQQVKAIVSK